MASQTMASSSPFSAIALSVVEPSNSISCPDQHCYRQAWRLLEKLGEGSYGCVYAARNETSGQSAALKIPNMSCNDRSAKNEAAVLKKVGTHRHIVDFIDNFKMNGIPVMLMERCEHSLRETVTDAPMASEPCMHRMFYQMVSAIAHLESLRIVHRDVKPSNFLLSRDAGNLKLCDFGFAKVMPMSGQLFGRFGTTKFMSPEMVGDGSHNLKTDVWSLGVTFYRILYGEYPYDAHPDSSRNLMQIIASGTPEPRYECRINVSLATKELVATMLHRAADTRISASHALTLPFLSSACDCRSIDTSNALGAARSPCKSEERAITDDSTSVGTKSNDTSRGCISTYSRFSL